MVGFSQTHSLVLVIEDRVVLSHEHVTQDIKRSCRSGDIETHESEETEVAIRNDVVLERQGVVLVVDGEGDIRVVSFTGNQVFA